MESIRKLKRMRPRGQRGDKRVRYGTEFKVRAVKLHLEEVIPSILLCRELGISMSTFGKWSKAYRELGASGLEPRPRGGDRTQLPDTVKEQIVTFKKDNPRFGVRRISQVLRRLFFLPASPETVRQTLHKHSLMDPPTRRKPQRNPG